MAGDHKLVLIEPDGFIGTANTVAGYIPQYGQSNDEVLEKQAKAAASRGWDLNDIATVSRPVNGMSIKPNTHAFVQVLKEDSTPVYLFNQLGQGLGKKEDEDFSASGAYKKKLAKDVYTQQSLSDIVPGAGGGSANIEDPAAFVIPSIPTFGLADPPQEIPGRPDAPPNMAAWTDWILQSVREQRMEKTQVVETFGDTYFYAFGERPRALQFQGLLLNSLDYNWRAIFWENWDRYFRATKLIEMNARMYIGWDDIIVEGYPINAAAAETADSPNAMTFQFTFYVTNYINTSAQSGFVSQKQARIARIRGGHQGGPGSAGRQDELAGFFRSNHGLEWIGAHGATTAGGKVEGALRAATGLIAKRGQGGLQNAAGFFTGSLLSDVIDGLGKTLTGYATSAAIGNQFFTNWLRQTSYNTLKFWKNIGQGEAEIALGVQRGEINAWFGFLSGIIDRIKIGKQGTRGPDSGDGSRSPKELAAMGGSSEGNNNPNWLGAPADIGANLSEAFFSGSIDRILGGLAFSIPDLEPFSVNTNPYGKALPGTATLVQMRPLEDMPSYGNEGLGTTQALPYGPEGGGGHVSDSFNTWGTYQSGSFNAGSAGGSHVPVTDF